MDAIAGWRERIDGIDARLLELLSERARCAIEIGRVKSEHGMDVLNPAREQFIFDRLEKLNTGPLGNDSIGRIFQQIIEECRRAEHELR